MSLDHTFEPADDAPAQDVNPNARDEAQPSSPEDVRMQKRLYFASLLNSGKYKPKQYDRGFRFKAPLTHGWMLPYLLEIESMFWGRWDYWCETYQAGKLLDRPIPRIEFDQVYGGPTSKPTAQKFLIHALNSICPGQGFEGWSAWTYFDYFLDWVLFGLGHPGHQNEPKEPVDGASMRLYQTFDLGPLILSPSDYLGELLAMNHWGRGQGFFPTPLHVCEVMCRMIMASSEDSGKDERMSTICDPCLGTGRMLLVASNYSLRLFGQDINSTVIRAALFNAYLYAPWMAKPFGFLERMDHDYTRLDIAPTVSDQIAELAKSDCRASAYTDWWDTEHDAATQPLVHPIKVRRKRTAPAPNPNQCELTLAE